ncbi:MAG: PAS domain S-box protein [Desulfobacca sp.]|nr:PAS domain S-box protein [Desulfobacca sp.]
MTIESEIVERLPVAIILVDQEDRITYFNPCAAEFFGMTRDEAAEKNYFEFLSTYLKDPGAAAVTHIEADCKQAMISGLSWETILEGKDGKILRLRRVPIHVSEIPTSGSVVVLEDITNYQMMVTDQLEQELLAQVSRTAHQLNQPLQIILGYISLMLMDLTSEQPQHSFLQKMLEQIEEAQKITKELSNIVAVR